MEKSDAKVISNVSDIVLVNPGDHPELVVDYLSSKLWLTREAAQALIHAKCGIIIQAVPCNTAAAEAVLMAALGMRVVVTDAGTENLASLFDISIRRTIKSPIRKIKRKLKLFGLPHKVTAADFHSPSGLEICGLSQKRALKCAKKLQKIKGVTVATCNQKAALFDVMSPPGLKRVEEREIHNFSKVLGCQAISGYGMLATGLSRDQLEVLTARFPNSGLIGVNREFERIDFYITGIGSVNFEDLTKFSARYGRAAAKALAAGQRFRIETNLSRPEARLVFEWLIAMGLEFWAEWHLGEC